MYKPKPIREFQGTQRLRDGSVIKVYGRETATSMVLSSAPLNGPYAMVCDSCDTALGFWSTSESDVRVAGLKAGWRPKRNGYICPKCDNYTHEV